MSKQAQNVVAIVVAMALLAGEALLYALGDSISSGIKGLAATVGVVLIAVTAVWLMIRSVK